jgi:hypothetical protein
VFETGIYFLVGQNNFLTFIHTLYIHLQIKYIYKAAKYTSHLYTLRIQSFHESLKV